ncbi:MAG: hypothetical protein ACYTGZ_08465 [Planctomycetota bacterium]|jgi:hypothetical protein
MGASHDQERAHVGVVGVREVAHERDGLLRLAGRERRFRGGQITGREEQKQESRHRQLPSLISVSSTRVPLRIGHDQLRW